MKASTEGKIKIDTGVFSRELLEKACREIQMKKQQQQNTEKSA